MEEKGVQLLTRRTVSRVTSDTAQQLTLRAALIYSASKSAVATMVINVAMPIAVNSFIVIPLRFYIARYNLRSLFIPYPDTD
jgi:hypothetical protein